MTTPSPNAADPTNASGGEQPSKKSRRLLAIAGVAVGTLTIVSALSGGGSGTNAAFSNVLLGVAFLIPSLWWFYCENAGQKVTTGLPRGYEGSRANAAIVDCVRHDPSSRHGRTGKAPAEKPALETSRSTVCCPVHPGHGDQSGHAGR